MIDLDIETEGLDVLLSGASHPLFAENPLFMQLGFALALEKESRETGETSRKAVELPGLDTLSDVQLRGAAGFLCALCDSMDADLYPRTFAFCWSLFAAIAEEINLRVVPDGVTVH
jgi:hypothetical protein